MSDTRTLVLGILTANPHKPPRVLANLIADAIDRPTPRPVAEPAAVEDRPDPPSWTDMLARLVDDGVATTRNRTDAALRDLGLEPAEIRAVVIERDFLRVYRWSDKVALDQTVPILCSCRAPQKATASPTLKETA